MKKRTKHLLIQADRWDAAQRAFTEMLEFVEWCSEGATAQDDIIGWEVVCHEKALEVLEKLKQ